MRSAGSGAVMLQRHARRQAVHGKGSRRAVVAVVGAVGGRYGAGVVLKKVRLHEKRQLDYITIASLHLI